MKKNTIGIFNNRTDAENFINHAHKELSVDHDEISYIYKNAQGQQTEVDTENMTDETALEGAGKGAKTGAAIGALAGLATVAGVIPVIGPLFASGPLLTALGITGAVGTTAAGAVTGAAVGGLVGALLSLGVDEDRAKRYEDLVLGGDILVAVHSDKDEAVAAAMREYDALEVQVYEVTV